MAENKDSQRGAETEVIELIANLIAAYSHHNELYNSLSSAEKKKVRNFTNLKNLKAQYDALQ